jgi:NAD(P)-dependent dehydrogenase (short-subunit alcohol dehydrogenase family)
MVGQNPARPRRATEEMKMSLPLEGKIALVTGGSRGIGRAIAEAFAEDGAAFIGVHYSSNKAAALDAVSSIKTLGSNAVALQAELRTDPASGAARLADSFKVAVREEMGVLALDILVNNACGPSAASLAETDEAMFDSLLGINLKAPFFLIQKLLPHVRNNGRIINISTGFSRVAAPTHAAYAAAKGGLNTLTLSLAAEGARRNITANCISPSITETHATEGWLVTEEARAYAASVSVFGRIGQTADIADIARFVASDRSRWITGQVIDATGGARI